MSNIDRHELCCYLSDKFKANKHLLPLDSTWIMVTLQEFVVQCERTTYNVWSFNIID